MQNSEKRIIIDTNLWISFLLTSFYEKLDRIITQDTSLLFSEELIEEFVEVTKRRKFKKYFSESDVESLIIKIRKIALFIIVKTEVETCRDVKDNFLLSLCIDGKATHLITGDKDLLILKSYQGTEILTINDYINEN